MKLIPSFEIDHTRLKAGVYLSRQDKHGDIVINTFDIRCFRPNKLKYFSTTVAHTVEHIVATWLRTKSSIKDKVVYFGPMGCRTGFYLVITEQVTDEQLTPEQVGVVFTEALTWGLTLEKIPGATELACGNYLDLDFDSYLSWAYSWIYDVYPIIVENSQYTYPKPLVTK